jgi:ABC-type lipoprotein release transport system permease subunit
MVVRDGAKLAGTGLAIGLLLAIGGTQALMAALGGIGAKGPAVLLQGASAMDPVSLIGVPALLAVVALGVSWAPAWRAGRLELGKVLRGD